MSCSKNCNPLRINELRGAVGLARRMHVYGQPGGNGSPANGNLEHTHMTDNDGGDTSTSLEIAELSWLDQEAGWEDEFWLTHEPLGNGGYVTLAADVAG